MKPQSRAQLIFVFGLISLLTLSMIGCTAISSVRPLEPSAPNPTPTIIPLFSSGKDIAEVIPDLVDSGPVLEATAVPVDLDAIYEELIESERVEVREDLDAPITLFVDTQRDRQGISPLIYGVTNAPADYVQRLRPTVNSWGGDGAVRYNWEDGNAWNLGASNNYRNSPVVPFLTEGHPAVNFLRTADENRITSRFIMPTLGWVAIDSNPETCTFLLPDGSCGTGNASTCQSNDIVGNPLRSSKPSGVTDVQAFARFLKQEGVQPDLISVVDEPELWGVTHYDVHPECTGYDEVLETYIEYAEMLRAEFPDAELMGPGTSSWFFYTNSALGYEDRLKHSDLPFLEWFLEQMRQYEQREGERLIDVLDIHYYPEGIYTRGESGVSGAQRLRATRSLYDPLYVDEGYIRVAIQLIPRMTEMINERYPGTRLSISEWNFGSDTSINGALAIAEVLGIFGREGLYMASYSSFPPFRSPGYYAFKIYTNYDDAGGKFGDIGVFSQSTNSELVSVYAAEDSESGNLHVIIINKINRGDKFTKEVTVELDNFNPKREFTYYLYEEPFGSNTDPGIQTEEGEITSNQVTIELGSESITHIIFEPVQERS